MGVFHGGFPGAFWGVIFFILRRAAFRFLLSTLRSLPQGLELFHGAELSRPRTLS